MSTDDDTFLSAYLDGQLDTDQQHLVDSVLFSSPELADRLRALSVVRELVAGLGRDPSFDITPKVMDKIRRRHAGRRFLSSSRPRAPRARHAALAAGALTVAAGVALIVGLVAVGQPRADRAGLTSREPLDNMIADAKSGVSTTTADDRGPTIAVWPRSPRSNSSAPTTHSVALNEQRPPLERDEAETERRGQSQSTPGDLELSRSLLGNPGERRLFRIKNGRDGKAQQQVASVVEHTTRFGFFKITVSQGIVIDPRHPDEATVFALLVNPKELDRLRDQLNVAFSDVVEEGPADAAVVTQLADIGRVQSLSPAPLGDVSISREALALQTRVDGAADNSAISAMTPGRNDPGQLAGDRFGPPARRGTARSDADDVTERDAGGDKGRRPSTSSSSGSRAANPSSGQGASRSRTDIAANAKTRKKPDEMILVVVWVSA